MRNPLSSVVSVAIGARKTFTTEIMERAHLYSIIRAPVRSAKR